jgi:predicted TPR repeat methyltransferase
MTSTTKDNWSATKYDTNANFVPVLGATILGMLDPQPTETILDLGCGDGVLTKDLEKMCAHVVGVDASANMIEKAKDLGCKDARVVDGHDLAAWFDNENIEQHINGKFDAVFSNAGKQKKKKKQRVSFCNPSTMSRRCTHI